MYNISNIEVYAFVGPSGTGKSYRAQYVAGENDIEYINSHFDELMTEVAKALTVIKGYLGK